MKSSGRAPFAGQDGDVRDLYQFAAPVPCPELFKVFGAHQKDWAFPSVLFLPIAHGIERIGRAAALCLVSAEGEQGLARDHRFDAGPAQGKWQDSAIPLERMVRAGRHQDAFQPEAFCGFYGMAEVTDMEWVKGPAENRCLKGRHISSALLPLRTKCHAGHKPDAQTLCDFPRYVPFALIPSRCR